MNASKSNGVDGPLCSPSIRAARSAANFVSCSSSNRSPAHEIARTAVTALARLRLNEAIEMRAEAERRIFAHDEDTSS